MFIVIGVSFSMQSSVIQLDQIPVFPQLVLSGNGTSSQIVFPLDLEVEK